MKYLQSQWKRLEDSKNEPLRIKAIEIIYKMDEVRTKIQLIQELAQSIVKYIRVSEEKMEGRKTYEIKDKSRNKDDEKKEKILKIYA